MTREEVIKWLESLKREIGKAENRTLWHYAESIDMAIETLSAEASQNLAEPNKDLRGSDLIRRSDALDALGEEPPVWYDGEDEIAERNQWRMDKAAIESLPSAEARPTGEWIPCSERLPEEYGEYLVTKRTIGWNCEEYGSNDIAYFDSDGFHKADKVTAWMPLPEPYKGGDSE